MPAQPDLDRLRSLKTLPQLIAYLRDELDWPVDQDAVEDDVTFQYAPEELGFDAATAVHIKEIKQLRPLDSRQPWGVFWVNFEKKCLPVVMLRRILGNLVLKKRADPKKANQRAWHLHDLLFISAYGEESDRAITFAHFSQPPDSPGDLPILKVLGWDDGDTVLHLVDAHRTLAEKLRWPTKTTSLDDWRNQWASAFTLRHREVITTTTELVEELARLADATRRRARTILARESERGPLRRLYAAFKTALIHDLTEDDFADVIAQTISYGLLIARFSRAAISAQNLVDMVPASNPFLRELLGTFLALAGRQSAFDFDELGIQDVVEVLNRSNADAVKADFGNRTRNEDPVIHFYEHFLAAYDRQKKIQRGVFYTPQPVVSYIVRGVHELLQKEFGIEDGLASTITWGDMLKKHPNLTLPKIRVPKAGKAEGEEVDLSPDEFFVMILDIATGTGTFLDETIEVIFQHLQAKWAKHGLQGMPIIRHTALRTPQFKDYWNAYVPAALLPRLYGYELMMAPYTIAHMKLALKFSEINERLGQHDYEFTYEGRANIYLTNSLEPPSGFQTHQFAEFFPALAHESAAVNTVKRTKRFTVAMGNPPYSKISSNLTPEMRAIVERYRFVGEERIKERGALQFEINLQDDYVKFFRFSEAQISASAVGVLGIITNNGYLSTPTLRGMRDSLMETFTTIWALDLHGHLARGEQGSDGQTEQNIFDIVQGVAVFLGSRCCARAKDSQVFHAEIYGQRDKKYAFLQSQSRATTQFEAIKPSPPFFLFVPHDADLAQEWKHSVGLSELFPKNSAGIITARDGLVIAENRQVLAERMERFSKANESEEAIYQEFNFSESKRFDLVEAQAELRKLKSFNEPIRRLLHRPFDERYIFFHRSVVWSLSRPMAEQMAQGDNLALVATRQVTRPQFEHVFVSRHIIEIKACSHDRNTQIFPLFVNPEDEELTLSSEGRANLADATFTLIAKMLGLKPKPGTREIGKDEELTPHKVFNYVYAILHSPGYRSRYFEFLRSDFPRLPLTGNLELFRELARLGGELVALHLLESPKLDQPITEFVGSARDSRTGSGDSPGPLVEKPTWSKNTVWLDKAQTTGFKGVREDVWNFHIGGYRVCEKWLKGRKGRNLSADDRAHYQKIIIALSETIRLMAEIDAVIAKHGGWPLK